MISTPVDAVHPDYARWYDTLSLGNDQTRRDARWVGIRAISGNPSTNRIEALVRLALKSRHTPHAAAVQEIRQAFRDADETYNMQGDDRELQVMAGIVLAVMMADGGFYGAYAALAITTTALAGARAYDLPTDLIALADEAIDRTTEEARTRPELSVPANIGNFNFDEAATKITQTQTWEEVASAVRIIGVTTGKVLNSLATRQFNLANAATEFFNSQDEELQILWWLIGGQCIEFACPFSELEVDVKPFAIATDLANETNHVPGPASLKNLMIRAGLAVDGELSVASAIRACKLSWLEGLVGNIDPSPVTTPVHFGMKRQIEVGDEDSWVAGWTAAIGVATTPSTTPLDLALLFYHERLLLLFEEN